MKTEIKYIELKSGFSDDGSAWIGLVTFSKSGKTLYFNNKAFQSLKGSGITGNYFDVESGDEYWISSVKKDLSDRHRFGGGKIYVERQILTEYLKILERTELPKNNYELIDIQTRTPKERINKLENKIHETSEFSDQIYTKNPKELTYDELVFLIEELIKKEKNITYNKTRRSWKRERIILETELENRSE